jgi:hypothetical protein
MVSEDSLQSSPKPAIGSYLEKDQWSLHRIVLRFVLILPSHVMCKVRFSKSLFHSGFLTNTLYTFIMHMLHVPSIPYLWVEYNKLKSSSPHPLYNCTVISPSLCPNKLFSSTPCFQTPQSFLDVTDLVSHLHKWIHGLLYAYRMTDGHLIDKEVQKLQQGENPQR